MNLVIGSTSQLGKYFPDTYTKISSRNIDFNIIENKKWESAYICFAEQRTYLANNADREIEKQFDDINYIKTKYLIEKLQSSCNKIIYYSTAELWNRCYGPISINTPFNFYENHYTATKHKMTIELMDKTKYPNVVIIFPFNFNSVFRGNEYLFGKIFNSIINKTTAYIGDIDYYREILHPKMIVNESIDKNNLSKDFIVGSGRLTHVGDFIKKLYLNFNLPLNLLKIDDSKKSIYRQNIFYSSQTNNNCSIEKVLDITIKELKERIIHVS
jgi:hypothetical protein